MHALANRLDDRPFTHVIIDEAQDISVPELRLVAALAGDRALEEIYATERHLLYVAATRARDFLWISGCDPLLEFVEDLVSS